MKPKMYLIWCLKKHLIDIMTDIGLCEIIMVEKCKSFVGI